MKHPLVAVGCLAGLTLCAASRVDARPAATTTVPAILHRTEANAAGDRQTIPPLDGRQLRPRRIGERQLPAGTVVPFREPTIWNRYKRYAIAGLIVFAAQLALIGTLLLHANRRRRAEQALRRSEARNGAMLRAMPDLLFVMSRTGVYLDYHARNPDDLFVPPEQFLGKSVFDVMPPDLATRFADAFADAQASGEARPVEYELPLKDGHRFFESRIVGIDDDQVLSVVRDVTEQRRAQKRLRMSEARYAMATAAGGVGVWDWTLETDELYVDPEVLRILGYDRRGANAQRVNWKQLVSPMDYARTRAAAQACIDGSTRRYNIEHRVMHRDGSIRWFQTSGSAVRRGDGTAHRMMGTFTDVTDRMRAEAAVRDRDSALLVSSRTIQDLAGRLIAGQELEFKRLARELHDNLSQSLALLAIDVEVMTGKGHVSPEAFSIADRVAGIATDVHLLSHRLHPFKLEVLGLVPAVQSLCDDVARQHRMAIEFQGHAVPAGLPPEVALCIFRIAQEGLRNVVKHARTSVARVTLSASDSDLLLHIADGGVGFVPEEQDVSGLGLISIRERVNFLGGRLAVHSQPGAGTRIAVSVPLKAVTEVSELAPAAPPIAESA